MNYIWLYNLLVIRKWWNWLNFSLIENKQNESEGKENEQSGKDDNNKQENNNPEIRDVEISNGLDNNGNNQGQGGFVFT